VSSRQRDRIRALKFLNHFGIGGTERQFIHVANGLDRSRFAVEVACMSRQGPLLEKLDPALPVHTYPVNGSFCSYRSIVSQIRLLNDVRRQRFDIVHTYGWYPNVFAVPPSRAAFHPAVIASIRDAGAYMTPAKVHALKIACRLADCVLANSRAGRDWLMRQGVRERKIAVIPNGIAVPPQTPRNETGRIRAELRVPAERPLCACIGRVVSGKGIGFYVQAARILADRGRDVYFLMIGAHSVEQNRQSELQSLAKELRIQDRMIFTGQRSDVPEILSEVDVVVHPSLTEGLSNVILEAMAAGIPVVATRVGGNPELVEDGRTGFLVSAGSAVEIADAICRLLDAPQMARAFGDRARKRVLAEFAIDRMLAQTEALYLRLCEQRLVLRR
jgi:glycosyltransferase involved in cell wall biosynthesis